MKNYTRLSFWGTLWIWLGAWLSCSGWLLSAIHELNAIGYAVSLGIFVIVWLTWAKPQSTGTFRTSALNTKWRWRLRHSLPVIFLLATIMIWMGGLLYAPTNFDALTYRLPRMLNWWTEDRWFWIPSFDQRLNYSCTGWEWLAMPLLVLTRSDRAMFLINALPYLLMPGLLFSIFRQLGVARKVAWTWMWLLPLAYGYATQAGGIGNDLLGTIYCLLSVHFGLRARRSKQASDIWLALVAAALMTGVKLSNLPLALPCLIAIWPALFHRGWHWRIAPVVAVICIVVSALPIMILNQRHTGSWNGDPANQYQMQIASPASALLVNSFLLAEYSLMPPVLPGSREINAWAIQHLPEKAKTDFPRLTVYNFTEIPGEETAGLGLGITLPLVIILIAALGISFRSWRWTRLRKLFPLVAIGTWAALLFYMARMGSEAGPRLLLPYYPLALVPLLLLAPQQRWLCHRTWRTFLAVIALGTLPVLLLSVCRPLWPAETIAPRLAQSYPQNKTFNKLAATYVAYSRRNDFLAPLRPLIPKEVRVIGLIASGNDTSYALWRPLGTRRVADLRAEPTQWLQQPGEVEWVVVKERFWSKICPVPLETWAREHHADIVTKMPLTELVSWGPEDWCLLHRREDSPAP